MYLWVIKQDGRAYTVCCLFLRLPPNKCHRSLTGKKFFHSLGTRFCQALSFAAPSSCKVTVEQLSYTFLKITWKYSKRKLSSIHLTFESQVYLGKVVARSQKGDLHTRLAGSNAGVRHYCPNAMSVCIALKAHRLFWRSKSRKSQHVTLAEFDIIYFLEFSAHPCPTVKGWVTLSNAHVTGKERYKLILIVAPFIS